MRFSQAFDVGRALSHGFEAFRAAMLPMFLGGAILSFTDSSCGGGGGGGGDDFGSSGSGSSGTTDNDWSDLLHGEGGVWLADWVQAAEPSLDELVDLVGAGALMGLGLGFLVAIVLLVAVLWVGLMLLRSWVVAGYLQMHKSLAETGQGTVSTLFGGGGKALPVFGYTVLVAVLNTGIFAVAGLPSLGLAVVGVLQSSVALGVAAVVAMLVITVPIVVYVSLGLNFGVHAIVLEDRGVLDALERSWTLTSGNRILLLLFKLVMAVVMFGAAVVGLLFCCVGALVTVPIMRSVTDFGFTESYLLLTRPPEETGRWAIWNGIG